MVSRRGFFGAIVGLVAAAMCPKSEAIGETFNDLAFTWKAWSGNVLEDRFIAETTMVFYANIDCDNPRRLGVITGIQGE